MLLVKQNFSCRAFSSNRVFLEFGIADVFKESEKMNSSATSGHNTTSFTVQLKQNNKSNTTLEDSLFT